MSATVAVVIIGFCVLMSCCLAGCWLWRAGLEK